jgi:hypothetical protein
MKQFVRAFLLIGFVGTMFGADPFEGTWKLDPARSSGTIPKDETVIIQKRGQALVVEVQVVTGALETSAFVIRYTTPTKGGVGQVEKGPYDGVSLKRVNGRTIETTYLSGGKEVRSTSAVVSKDGTTMTSTGRTLSSGESEAWKMVFEKQPRSGKR